MSLKSYRPVVNVLGGIRVTTSLQGQPIPIVYGRTRIAPNLLWYGDFFAVKLPTPGLSGSGGASGQSTGQYDYGAAIVLGLCQGPISSIGNIWTSSGNLSVNETQETYTVPGGGGSYTATQAATYIDDLGVTRADAYSVLASDFGAPSTITLTGTQQTPMEEGSTAVGHYTRSGANNATYNFGAGDGGKTMTVTYTYAPPITGGGVPTDPISSVGFTFFDGSLGQAVWSYLTSKHPSQAIGYSGEAYIATPVLDLGVGGVLPNFNFEVYAMLPFGSGAGDSNPSDVLYDLLTNAVYGCGIDTSFIGDMTQYSNYCLANGLLISPAIDSTRTASDWIKDILDATNSEIIESGGKLLVLPYGDTTIVANGVTFQPATDPIYDLNPDDFIRSGQQPAVQVERPTVQDAYNSVRVEYFDRGNSYNPTIVEGQDLQAIDAYKYRPEGTRQYHMFCLQAAAAKCAGTLLARLVYIRNKFKVKIPQKYILLDPMDLVTITVPELGLNKFPVRILSIDEQANRTLDITAEEFPWGCSGPTLYPKQSQIPGGANAYAPPGSVNTPIMFEALSRLNNQIGHSVWFGTSGSNPNWGGCNIWASVDGGNNYQKIATAIGRTNMGKLTAALASHADPDTLNTLSVDLTESLGSLVSGTMIDADLNALLCFVSNGPGSQNGELVSYETATLTATNKYDLTYLRRGVFGSVIGSHAINSNFMFFDNAVEGWNYDVGFIGTTVHFKFTSFNQSGLVEESLANVTDYPFLLTGASIGLLSPAHSSYRPTSNPLTAHDAGATATINVAAFFMRVPGMADIPFASGAITGLLHNTLYYVYFSDPGFVAMSPTYLSSTAKEDAIDAAGIMFVGSIFTPRSGAPDTIGNNDGGGGAQIGMLNILQMSLFSAPTLTGTGAVTNPQFEIDGDLTTYADFTLTANAGNNLAEVDVISPPGITRSYRSLTLKVRAELPVNSVSGGTNVVSNIGYGLNGPGGPSASTFFTATPGVTVPLQTFSAVLPVGQNLSQVIVFSNIGTNTSNLSGSLELKVYEVWIEAVE